MILVGSTGFVGSNLMKSTSFNAVYHSTDIYKAYGSKPDILIYAGVTGTKFLANRNPKSDSKIIDSAIENIKKINAKKIVLISTIDVNESLDIDESTESKISFFGTYGQNRLFLENWVEQNCHDYHIIRLPAIYGENLKKNFIHDLIFPVPPMLTKEKYKQVIHSISEIEYMYEWQDDGMYHYINKIIGEKKLAMLFLENAFNALSFTNPNSTFQYYNLGWLWSDINKIIDLDIRKINLVTEPICSKILYESIYGKKFNYEVLADQVNYNLHSKYADALGGEFGYVYSYEKVIDDLLGFINTELSKM